MSESHHFRKEFEGDGPDPDRGADLWWEYVDLDADGPVDRAALRELLDTDAGEVAAELADGAEPASLWAALGELHLGLDRAVADDALALPEAAALRRRLNRLLPRLHREGLSEELRDRSELLRDITHDLRVPLNSIVFLADSLFGERHGGLNEAQRRQVGGVYSASATLLNLVNDLLDLTRASRDELESTRVPFSVEGVLDDVRHLVHPVTQHHGAELEVDLRTEGSWRGDPRLVRRLLLNLVTNAVEAAGEGGSVRVAVDGPREDGAGPEMPRITVEDTGPGVDVERAEALLDPGELSGWRDLLDGTEGLGLLITGRLVRAAGGEISVERREAGGSRFTVLLPYAPEDPGGAGTE